MALTTAQLATLKADILADPAFSGVPNNSDGDFFIALAYDEMAVPSFVVWRTNITTSDIKKATVWTEYISRSAGERAAFELIIADNLINAADVNIRQGFTDIFSGPGAAGTRANLLAAAKRNARRIEKLFAVGPGTDALPANMTFEGTVSYQDIGQARRS